MTVLSIIIVNWNTRDFLERCLETVEAEADRIAPRRTETIVVDNQSSDGSTEMIRRRFPWVRLIESGKNFGFAGGNNVALRESRGTYVLLLNPDTELLKGSLVGLIEFMETNPRAGGAGPALLNPDRSLQPSSYPAPTVGREFWRLLHLDGLRRLASYPLATWRRGGPRRVDVIQGACLMIKREALEQVGFFDVRYFMYTEEVDLCYRLRSAGWELYWIPSLGTVHYSGRSTQQTSREMFLHLYRSKIRYFRKHYGVSGALGYKVILLLASLARLLPSPLAFLESNPARTRHLTLAGNYARLLLLLPKM